MDLKQSYYNQILKSDNWKKENKPANKTLNPPKKKDMFSN